MGFQAVKCRYIEGSKNGPVNFYLLYYYFYYYFYYYYHNSKLYLAYEYLLIFFFSPKTDKHNQQVLVSGTIGKVGVVRV